MIEIGSVTFNLGFSFSYFNFIWCLYSGRRLFQYNEYEFRFKIWFISRFLTAYMHKKWKQIEVVDLKSFSLITCKLVIKKKLVNNSNAYHRMWATYIDPYSYEKRSMIFKIRPDRAFALGFTLSNIMHSICQWKSIFQSCLFQFQWF